MCDVLSRSVFW